MHTTPLSRLSASLIFFVSAAGAWASPPTLLYDGSSTPDSQNWQIIGQLAPYTVTVGSGAEAGTTRFTTSTSGVNLYRYTESATNFIVSIRLKVNSVSPHNQLDAGLMFSVSNTFPAPFGTGTNRSEMLYIDPASVGWGDDSQSAPLNHIGAFHEYAIRYQSGQLTVYVDADYAAIADGTATGILSKTVTNPITTSAHFVFGDQSNDANVNGDFVVDYVKFQNLDLPDSATAIPTLEPTSLAALTGLLTAAAAGLHRRRRRDSSKTGN